MPRIIGINYKNNNYQNYKSNRFNHRKALAIFLIGQAAVTTNVWGVVQSVAGNSFVTVTTPSGHDSNTDSYSITAGTGGALAITGILGTVDPSNPAAVSIASANTNRLGNYTITVGAVDLAYLGSTATSPTIPSPSIDMTLASGVGTVNIINGYSSGGANLVGHIYRIDSTTGLAPINSGTVINFTGATAKLNLTQGVCPQFNGTNNAAVNQIYGNILGSNSGDTITLNGGLVNGDIVFGNGANTFTINGTARLNGTGVALTGGTGGNTISINGTSSIVGATGSHAIDIPAAALGQPTSTSSITITGSPIITGGINAPAVNNVLNIGNATTAANFNTNGTIVGMQTINVNNTVGPNNFTVNNPITNIADQLLIQPGAVTTVAVNGDLSGGGIINNSGNIALTGGTIGATMAMGAVTNSGIIAATSATSNINISSLTNTSTGIMNLQNNITATGTIINNGYLNLQSGGTINAASITTSGTMITAGTINAPITFGNNGVTLTINGGSTRVITGNVINGGTGEDVLNINVIPSGGPPATATFTINNPINNVNTINVQGATQLTVNRGITGVINSFTTSGGATSTTTTIASGGDLSGGGNINNAGTITLTGSGTIGAIVPMGAVTNSGTINAGGGNVKVGAIINQINGTVNIQSSNVMAGLDGSNVITNAGHLTIGTDPEIDMGAVVIPGLGGDLSTAIVGTTLMNSGTLTLRGNSTMMHSPNSQLGDVVNTGTMIINNTAGLNIYGSLTNNYLNYNPAALTITSQVGAAVACKVATGDINNACGTINIGANGIPALSGDLSSISSASPSILINGINQTITVAGTGTIGANNALGAVTNSGTINAGGGNITVGAFTNNAINALLNITKGIIKTGNITNTLGTINIGDPATAPDLSGVTPNASTLINAANQTITISGTGTVGAHNPLGTVTNNGTINAGGGNVKIGNFSNNSANAVLNITSGDITTGNINNTLGTITIGANATGATAALGGDLSSTSATSPSTLINAINQNITIAGTGTIGANNSNGAGPLGAVTNSGTINAGGGNIIVGVFTNNATNALLNITNGIVKTGNINNTLGTITIGDLGTAGDLSGVAAGTSTLTNATNQIITISGSGAIGVNNPLGAVTNSGTINAMGGNMNVGAFTNNSAGAVYNITSGNVTVGNIANTLGMINIIGNGIVAGPDLSSILSPALPAPPVPPSTLTNAANQTITIANGGTVGATTSLGAINNLGTINVATTVFKAGDFTNGGTNNLGAITTINNSGTGATQGVRLTSVNNYGVFNISNNQLITDVVIGPVTNNSGGVFNINGPLTAAGNFANSQGAIVNLGANFDIGAGNTLTNNGTVNMLMPVSMSHGGYTLGSTGTHILTIDNGTPRTLTLTNGACNFSNGSTIQIETTGDYLFKDNQTFNVVIGTTAAATLGATPPHIIGNTELVSFTTNTASTVGSVIANTNIQLTAHRISIASVLSANDNNSSSLTGTAVGTIIDNLINTGVTGDLAAALSNFEKLGSLQDVQNAANQLLPNSNIVEMSFNSPSLAFAATESRVDTIARLDINNIHTGTSGYAAGSMQANDGLWIKGLGGSNLQKQRDTFVGYNANSYGTAFGVDSKVLSNTWVGVAGSFVGTNIKSKDFPAKRTNVTSYQTTLYTSFSTDNYYVDSFAGMAFNTYKTLRRIKYAGFDRTATAKFMGLQPSVKVATGYIHKNDDFRIIPNLSLQYSVLNQRAYTETGAGNAGSSVAGAIFTQLEAGAGIKFAILHHENDDLIYNPDIHFMFFHDFKAQTQETVSEFIGGGGQFRFQGITPNKDTYNIGAGLTLIRDDRLHFIASYELKMKSKFVSHSGSLAVRYEL